MAVQAIAINLRGYYGDGRNVTSATFVEPLELSGSDRIAEVLCDRGQWKSALIVFSRRRVADFEKESEPSDALAAAIESDFEYVATWLTAHRGGVDRIRSDGLDMDLFLDLWIDDAQLDLSYPPSLLLACGQLGLKLEMITND